MAFSCTLGLEYNASWRQLEYLNIFNITQLFECCCQLRRLLNNDRRAWCRLFQITRWDVVPNSFETLRQQMTMCAAVKQMASWRLALGIFHLDKCSLSPTLAGLCTQASLIRAGFEVQAGDAQTAEEARSFFFVVGTNQSPYPDANDSEGSDLDPQEHAVALAFGNSLCLPCAPRLRSECGVSSPCADVEFDEKQFGFAVCFHVRGYTLFFESHHEFGTADVNSRVWADAAGDISVCRGASGKQSIRWRSNNGTPGDWTYLSWQGLLRNTIIGNINLDGDVDPYPRDNIPDADHYHLPFHIRRPPDSEQSIQQMSDDMCVPRDVLDKFVIAGFAGQCSPFFARCSPFMRLYGDLLFYLAMSMGVDDIPSLIPSWNI